MPLNTRVGRCVTKLRNKYGYGKAIGICQHSTKQNYLTGETMRKKRTRRRKKRGGTHAPTWIIKATPQAVNKFRTKIFNSSKYISVEDEEAADIMDYISVEAETNDDNDRWFMMKFDEGSWYPGEEPTYDKSISECSRPCYQVDSTGIRPILTRQTSHGSQKRRRKTRRRRRRRKRTRRRKKRR